MRTRCLTIFKEENKAIAIMYRHCDVYPDGHGKELAEFLYGMTIVHGIQPKHNGLKIANGMGCLAAQVIAHFKTAPGGIYLYPVGTTDVGEEYVYTVYEKNFRPYIKVETGPPESICLFDGEPEDFAENCKEEHE